MSKGSKRWLVVSLVLACSLVGGNSIVQATQSTNYRLDESSIGTNGLIESGSTNYRGSSSTGGSTVGESSSTNYQVQAGPETTNDPTLSFAINNGNVNFGDFSASTPTTTTATFSVTNYTAYGYGVYIIGDPPRNDGASHSILAMGTASPELSAVGTEQFGINLRLNTTFGGSNPVQTIFGLGAPDSNYNQDDKFRFVNGERIAYAPKSSGQTTYTITYLVNVRALTPGGIYTTDQSLIVVGTY